MKIAICDDEKIFLKKMNNLIVSNYANPDKLIICEFESGEQFLSQFKANQFDVIIIEIENSSLPVDVNNLITSKENKAAHGIGMQSIRQTVENMNGW